MKKLFSILLLFLGFTAFSQNTVAVTATIAGVSTAKKLPTNTIRYVEKRGSTVYVGVQNPAIGPSMSEWVISDVLDSVVNRANRFGIHLVKFVKATSSSNNQYAINVDDIINIAAYANASTPGATSAFWVKWPNGIKVIPIVETVAQIVARVDSTSLAVLRTVPLSQSSFARSSSGDSLILTIGVNRYAVKDSTAGRTSTSYQTDTTYTQTATDQYIIIKQTAAVTLTLLNPATYIGRDGITITNIGSSSGAITLAGGFTVKDLSDASLTTIAVNTAVKLVPVNTTGSTFIWQQVK